MDTGLCLGSASLKNMKRMVIISSPSGGGKNTLINALVKKNSRVEHSISTTTRKTRAIERADDPYYFVSREEFEKMIAQDKFLEWARVLDQYYGTTRDEVERIFSHDHIAILDIDIQGAMQLKKQYPEVCTIFIEPPSLEILAERLRKRGTETEEQILQRLTLAKIELSHKDQYDFVIVNDNLDDALTKLTQIVDRL
jgi:guanylate kinase